MPISWVVGLNGVGITGLEFTGASCDAPIQPTIGM